MIINKTVEFKANTTQVWDLLVNPAMSKQYMFGCEVLSEWKIGDPVIWKGKTEDGKDIVYVKGDVIEYDAGKKLKITMFDPNIGMKDIPENYTKLTYQVTRNEDGTSLTIIQEFLEAGENAEKRYEESLKGWDMIIPVMKKLIEK